MALGAVAAKALFGRRFGSPASAGGCSRSILPLAAATIHPSAILRQREESQREAEREAFASDLAVLARALAG